MRCCAPLRPRSVPRQTLAMRQDGWPASPLDAVLPKVKPRRSAFQFWKAEVKGKATKKMFDATPQSGGMTGKHWLPEQLQQMYVCFATCMADVVSYIYVPFRHNVGRSFNRLR